MGRAKRRGSTRQRSTAAASNTSATSSITAAHLTQRDGFTVPPPFQQPRPISTAAQHACRQRSGSFSGYSACSSPPSDTSPGAIHTGSSFPFEHITGCLSAAECFSTLDAVAAGTHMHATKTTHRPQEQVVSVEELFASQHESPHASQQTADSSYPSCSHASQGATGAPCTPQPLPSTRAHACASASHAERAQLSPDASNPNSGSSRRAASSKQPASSDSSPPSQRKHATQARLNNTQCHSHAGTTATSSGSSSRRAPNPKRYPRQQRNMVPPDSRTDDDISRQERAVRSLLQAAEHLRNAPVATFKRLRQCVENLTPEARSALYFAAVLVAIVALEIGTRNPPSLRTKVGSGTSEHEYPGIMSVLLQWAYSPIGLWVWVFWSFIQLVLGGVWMLRQRLCWTFLGILGYAAVWWTGTNWSPFHPEAPCVESMYEKYGVKREQIGRGVDKQISMNVNIMIGRTTMRNLVKVCCYTHAVLMLACLVRVHNGFASIGFRFREVTLSYSPRKSMFVRKKVAILISSATAMTRIVLHVRPH